MLPPVVPEVVPPVVLEVVVPPVVLPPDVPPPVVLPPGENKRTLIHAPLTIVISPLQDLPPPLAEYG